MTPRLILLTGPAADEVARVLRKGTHTARLGWNFPTWDAVREYVSCLIHICYGPGAIQGRKVDLTTKQVEQGICSLPGGEEWLVGLVLPGTVPYTRLPARLAILAPEPPPLLVERVRAWGGEMWHCGTDILSEQMWEDCPEFQPCIIVGNTSFTEHTWPEAVRAALGEAE